MNTTARQRAKVRGNGGDWYRIKNLDGGTAEISIYDEIGYLGVSAQGFINELKSVQADQITLRINSPGGEIFDGIAIMNAIRSHPAQVTAYVDGVAASIASVIAMAGDRLVMMPHSQLMIHDGSGLCVGNAADMRDMADLLDKQSDNIANVYKEKAGGLAKTWRNRMRAETWYSAEEAVAAGLADEVAQRPARRPAEMSNQWDLSVYRYAGRSEAPDPPLTNQDQPGGQPEETDGEELVATTVPVHHTDTVDTPWDGGEAERRLPSPMSVATAREVAAWYDAEQVEDDTLPKQAIKLPHHEVDADGVPGAANLPAVRNALARLSQSDIPESDWDAVRAHLQAHLADGTEEDQQAVHEDVMAASWSPDMFRTAMAKASGLPPEDLPATFRNAVVAVASQAPEIPAAKTSATTGSESLGWQEPAAEDPDTFRGFFRDIIAREANQAPAVITEPAPEPEQDPYDPTVIIRALREANQ